jgi:hypothetical protein
MAGSVVSIYDYQVYLFYNGNKIGTNKADIVAWTQTYYEKTYGTYNSTWGATLTSTIVNDDSFGVMLQVKNDNTTWDVDAYVDSIRIRVYYTTIASYTMGVSFPIYLTDNLLSEDCDCTDIDGLSWTGSYAVGPAGEGVLEDQPSDLSTVHPLRPVGTLKTVGYVGPFQLYIPNLLDGLNVSRKDSPLASAYRGTNALGKRMQVVDERSFDVVVPTGTDFEMMGLVDMNEIVPIDGSQFVDENEAMTMRGFAYVYGINPRYHNPQFSKITVTTDIFTHINSRLLFDHTTGLNDGTRLNMTYTPTSLDSQYEMKTGLSEFTTYFNKVQKSDGFAAAGFDVDPAKKCLVVTSVCETLNQYAYMTSSFKQDMTAPFYAEADIFVATSATATKSSDQNCLDAAVNYEVMARDFKIMIAAVDKWLVDHADVPPEIVYIRKGGVKQPTYVSWAKYNYDMLVRWDNWFTHYGSEANFVWINNPDGNNTNLFGPSEVIHTSDGKIKSIYIHTDDYTDIDTAVLEDAGITDVYVHSRYETSPSYTLVLPYVIDLLEGTGIRVHAWINAPTGYHPTDTSTNTTVQTLAATIVSDYDVAGIVLDGFRWDGSTHISHNESPDGNLAVQTFHKNVYNAVKSADSSKTVTISIKAEITKTHSPHYDSDYYYGQNYALLAPYCDILAPMTYVGDYAYEADPWIDDVVTFIRQYTSKPIVPVLETYITGTSNSKSQATLITEAEIALQHGAGFGLFRYGLIDNNNFPTAASDVTVVLPSDVGVGTGLFIGNKDIGLTPESTSGIRVRLITQSDGNYVEVDTYNSGVYSNLTGTPLGMSITGCKIKVLIDAENKATVWYNTGSNDVKVVDRVNSQIGQIEDIIVALFADSMTNVDYYHGYNNFNFYTPTYDDGGSTTTDDSAYNVIIAPPGDMNVTPNFYRTSRYGPLPCYINYGTAVTQKPLSFKIDPRDYYDGAVKLWDGGTKVYNTNHNWYDRSNETYNPVSMDNGFTRLDVDIENNIIEFYGYVGGWNLINTFSIGTINEVKPILISSEEITLRINDTYWNLKRGKPHLLIDHRYTDISYTAKQYYFHGDEDGNLVADQISGVNQAVSMDSCFYACVYNTSDRYRLQIMKVNKEYPIKNDRIPADSTTGIGWYDRDESNPLDKYDFRAKEWIYQPQTNIEY